MKSTIYFRFALAGLLMMAGLSVMAQKNAINQPSKTNQMKTYLIERSIPDAQDLNAAQLKDIAVASCGVIDGMGPQIKWIQSYVVDDKFYCVYQAESEDLIREHAKKGGFPANNIMLVSNIFGPANATAPLTAKSN